jgi:hypothetical protein
MIMERISIKTVADKSQSDEGTMKGWYDDNGKNLNKESR